MPITADKVRELVARGEGTTLDFKEADYDWSKGKQANAELAKDLMAIANVLGPNAAPGYILIGVADDRRIGGIPPSSHVDDATLHQKVRSMLNASPDFIYGAIDVEAVSVGVYEIRPGGRPFFPLTSSPPLQRSIAIYRSGTASEIASPTQIIEWHKEDDSIGQQLRSLELQEREAERRIFVAMTVNTRVSGAESLSINYHVKNQGRRVFQVAAIRWRIEWKPLFYEAVGYAIAQIMPSVIDGEFPPEFAYLKPWFDACSTGNGPAGYVAPHGEWRGSPVTIQVNPPLGIGHPFDFKYTRAQALEHFSQAKVPVSGFTGDWLTVHLDAELVGELGTMSVASLRV